MIIARERQFPGAQFARIGCVAAAVAFAGCQSTTGGGSRADVSADARAAAISSGLDGNADAALVVNEIDRLSGSSGSGGSVVTDPYAAAMRSGQLHNAFGDQEAAESAFASALEIAEARHGADSPALLGPLLQLALTASIQRRVAEAESMFSRAERLLTAEADVWDSSRFRTYKAVHLANRGKPKEAFALAREANLMRRDLLSVEAARNKRGGLAALAPGLAELAHGLTVESTLALRLGKLEVADVAAALARRVIIELDVAPDWWLAEIDELVGRVEAERREFSAARDRIESALQVKREAFGERRPVAMTLLALGRVHHLEGDSEAAVDAMRQGLDILRTDPKNTTALGFGALSDFITAGLTAAAADESGRPELNDQMFQASQMIYQGVTSRTINLAVAKLAARREGAGETAARLQRAAHIRDGLRLEFGREAAKPPRERDPERVARLRGAVDKARALVQSLDRELEQSSPGLAAMLAPSPVTAADMGVLLGPDEALVAFSIGPDGAYVFVARDWEILVARVSATGEELERRIRDLRAAFAVDLTGSAPPFNLRAAHELYEILFGPAGRALDGATHLIVVPSGPLASLPFGVLLDSPAPASGAADYRTAPWLATRYAISTFPSVRAFADLRQLRHGSEAPNPLLGVADPVLEGRGASGMADLERHCLEGSAPPDLIRSLPPLPDTSAELKRVARALGGGVLATGARATEDWVRGQALDQYRVLYFATHGLLPGELKCQSEPALVLTPPSSAREPESDGLLTASEVALLSLDADLVVLSACNTASAAGEFGGEALSGLARSFFHAGARALLVSHWQVNSAATTRLMTHLFEKSTGGRALSESLRQAQRLLISRPETSHPIFWGAFSLIGDGAAALRLG